MYVKKVSACIIVVVSLFIFSDQKYIMASNVAKKDGTFDQRNDDLMELCRDYVFYRNKILIYAKAGDHESAAKARLSFQQTLSWLDKYKQSDVSAGIEKAESEIISRSK